MRKLIVVLLSLVMMILICGCSASKNSRTNEVNTTQVAKEAETSEFKETETSEFTDSCGRKVKFKSKITKIAVSGPLTQIVLYSLAPEMLVGFSSEWMDDVKQYIPEEYLNLPVLGQLYGGKGELNLEELLKADPDVVIDIGEAKDTMVDDMDNLQKQTGIPFIHIDATTKTMSDAYHQLGQLLNLEERADQFAIYCEKVYQQTMKISDEIGDKKTSILYLLGAKGENVIAKGSYHAEIIDLLCNNTAVVDNPSPMGSGNEVDMEQILQWNPDVIIFAPDSVYDKVVCDKTWQQLKAIKNGNYYIVPYGPYNWMGFPPSVQRLLGMLWLSDLLYPDLTDYDLKTEVIKYYDMFYHYQLTDGQYQAFGLFR